MFGRLPMTAKAAAMLLVDTSLKDPVMAAMVTEDNLTLQRTTAEDNSTLQRLPGPLYPPHPWCAHCARTLRRVFLSQGKIGGRKAATCGDTIVDVGDDTWLVKMIDPAVKRLYTHRLQKDTLRFCSMGGCCVK